MSKRANKRSLLCDHGKTHTKQGHDSRSRGRIGDYERVSGVLALERSGGAPAAGAGTDPLTLAASELRRVDQFTCGACAMSCTIDRFDVAGRRFPFGGRCSLFEKVWKRKSRPSRPRTWWKTEPRCSSATPGSRVRRGNPVSVEGKSGVSWEIRWEIRCRFIILARKDELTPDFQGSDTGRLGSPRQKLAARR